jgi:hypothetical protein
MAADYIANCPISMPIDMSELKPEVDLNGFMFSYEWGPVYVVNGIENPQLRLPGD